MKWASRVSLSAGAGDDPLEGVSDGKDINSIAGVLKLYFRELREPLFPLYMFDELIACSSEYTESHVLQELSPAHSPFYMFEQPLLHPLPRRLGTTLVSTGRCSCLLTHLSCLLQGWGSTTRRRAWTA